MLNVQAVTINANTWSSAGHVVNQIYDLLYMMGRDDIAVGVGGEGGILPNGTILPNVGGYLPIIEQVLIISSFMYTSSIKVVIYHTPTAPTFYFYRHHFPFHVNKSEQLIFVPKNKFQQLFFLLKKVSS